MTHKKEVSDSRTVKMNKKMLPPCICRTSLRQLYLLYLLFAEISYQMFADGLEFELLIWTISAKMMFLELIYREIMILNHDNNSN